MSPASSQFVSGGFATWFCGEAGDNQQQPRQKGEGQKSQYQGACRNCCANNDRYEIDHRVCASCRVPANFSFHLHILCSKLSAIADTPEMEICRPWQRGRSHRAVNYSRYRLTLPLTGTVYHTRNGSYDAALSLICWRVPARHKFSTGNPTNGSLPFLPDGFELRPAD